MSGRVIGLYGGSGAGKSSVAHFLEAQGARVIDADLISREVASRGGSAYSALRETFPAYFDADGELMRRELGRLVFSDPAAKSRLEAVIQPRMRERILALIHEAPEETIILDCALLLEPAFAGIADENWLVRSPREKRIARIMARDGLNAAEAEARVGSQASEDTLAAGADRIIDNDGTPEDLARKLRYALKQI